jgi:hypothetical protein
MTLTHMLPTMRRSIPDPLSIDSWPEHTAARGDDVVIGGVSMLRLAELCDTPCVHTAAAVIPGTGGRASDTDIATVVVATVAEVEHGLAHRAILDAGLAACHAVISETRLIGRISPAASVPTRIGLGDGLAMLPADLHDGDLVAIPCTGTTRRRDLALPIGRCGR